ncbi:MAG: hypothetical protein IT347_01220 [Candidatus Eisenbacteria bacterium]|nr:hypothetical protein [Candidatus Eisenbacteria bacterium]
MRPLPRFLAAVLLLAALAPAGCGRNKAGLLLVPTGIRPAPETWPGGMTGSVYFYSDRDPGLALPPFPPTRVELFLGGVSVAVDSLAPDSRDYHFTGLAAGTYSMVVRSSAFLPVSRGGLPVRDGVLDAGSTVLTLNESAVNHAVYIVGTMPGFAFLDLQMGTTQCNQDTVGIHTYPGDFAVPTDIPAGTYRLKFVDDDQNTYDGNLIGWGGSPAETLVTPLASQPTVHGSGPSTDLVVRFAQTGQYAFRLDARRQRFSIALIPPAPTAGARR